ncbi:hypothetical protein SODALDRAFT_285992 [Sodiomyces alkalinus F11]|uniref:Uncharacterized protein n=1 Tax=Sodiomyces alkalinus (strain CBS 110278 / VKM F-3762 / F11) TaxID=1314773 RepID=A0A3N2PJY1_SODAK|nr:hypothetical protein SODALDRAFT_285992 [Sodiomyces alkalinus F11]ROT34740.1 hypothetical protein SODALDRAFT_285992 [Sodiomyces alkalinus F11]
MSPEALSSLFQHRPIRPLPKRRLRERLSPEAADSIEYPPSNQNSSPLFLYPGVIREEPSPTLGKNYTVVRDSGYEDGPGGSAEGGESDEDESKRFSNSKVVRRSHPEILNRAAASASASASASAAATGQGPKPGQSKNHTPQPPPSTASSADGYDSFENTNNKKKRKIPTAGDSSLNGTHSLAEGNSIGVSGSTPPSNDADLSGMASPSYYGTGTFVSNSQGISGPGRGRFGRSRNGRSPLRALSDAANSWVGRGVKPRPPQWPGSPNESSGIISSAIAKAEKLSGSAGQENVSLLHQPPSHTAKPRPTSAQFTFTCDSQVPGTQWPGTDPGVHSLLSLSGYAGMSKSKHASMATQTGVDPAGVSGGSSRVLPNPRASGKKKKNRRRGEKELQMAAARRRQEAYEKLTNHAPRPEDVWICEFCEYERIFGVPPYALIRQYELKDQKVRRQEEERKRLLEKAKAKSRKAKKAPKSPPKSTQDSHSAAHAHSHNMDSTSAGQSNTTDEEYPHPPEDDFDNYSLEDPPMLLSDDPGPDDVGPERDVKEAGKSEGERDRDRTGPDLKHHQYPPSGDPLRHTTTTGGVAT